MLAKHLVALVGRFDGDSVEFTDEGPDRYLGPSTIGGDDDVLDQDTARVTGRPSDRSQFESQEFRGQIECRGRQGRAGDQGEFHANQAIFA